MYGEQVEGQGNWSVNTGFMKLEASGNLKRCRGKTSPVKVKPTAYVQCALDKGVTKHTNHYKEVHERLEYVLLYPVHSEVINLPGTTSQSTSKAVKYIQTTLRVCCWLNFHWRGLASASLLIAWGLQFHEAYIDTSVSLHGLRLAHRSQCLELFLRLKLGRSLRFFLF